MYGGTGVQGEGGRQVVGRCHPKEWRSLRGVQGTEGRADRRGKVSKVHKVRGRGTEAGRGRVGTRDRGS